MPEQEQVVISSKKVTLPIPLTNYYVLLEGVTSFINARTKEVSPWYWELLLNVSLIFLYLLCINILLLQKGSCSTLPSHIYFR